MANLDFPFHVDNRGRSGTADDADHIRDLIEQVLFTAPGERVNRPTFGSGLMQLVFAPNSAATWSLIAHHVQEALGWWEPRIEVTDVDVRPDITDTSRLIINIQYKVKATNNERNLVYPFYLSG